MAASQRLHHPAKVLPAFALFASKTMIANLASFTLVTVAFGLGAFAIVASPEAMPNQEGLTKCLQLHPERYCRIANGFSVEPLDKAAN
jgi:hypothetical protein